MLKLNLAFMNYFDSDMSKSTNTVVYFDWKTRLQTMSHIMYAAKFEQTFVYKAEEGRHVRI